MMLLLGSSGEVTALGQERAISSASIIEKPLMPARGRIYDCGANAVFCMARLLGVNITYTEALELVPVRPLEGNNMLELKAALSTLDCQMEGFWLDANELTELTVPAIVLHRPSGCASSATNSNEKIGHFLIAWPLDPWHMMLIDLAGRSRLINRQAWRANLLSRGVSRVAVLIYTPPKADS